MNQELKEYIQSLIPKDFPDGNKLVEEGRELAKDIEWKKSRFLKEYGFESHLEYRKQNLAEGKQTYQLLVGLSTLEEELDAVKAIDAFYKRTGFEVRSMQSIPNALVGVPPEYWENAPKPTSYMMEKAEDWCAHTEAAPVDICWQDWHLASPNNLKETEYALNAGTSRLGCFSTFLWDYPGYSDEIKRYSDMCRSMGILSAKKDEGLDCVTYPEDGLPGYFMDVVSYMGYEMVEHYIIEDLCGARMAFSFGGLLSEILPRMSFALALEKLYGTPEHPFVTYYNGSTNEQWDHDLETNYGLGASEMLIESVINLKYNMPVVINPVSITEALRVPTLEELFNIVKCGIGVERKAKEWLEIIDFSKFENMRDFIIEKGTEFYNNVMSGFKEAGVNINDPLEMIMVLKHFDPVRFEQEFSPSKEEFGQFKAYIPTVLGRETMKKKDEIVADLKAKGYENSMKGKKVICASADGHSYGLMLIDQVWSEMNADVVNCGSYMEASFVLDLADEEDADAICVSVHCGQILDYAKQLVAQEEKRGKKYKVLLGGMLNAMVPGYTEPIDVSDVVEEMGLCASNDFEEQLNYMCQ